MTGVTQSVAALLRRELPFTLGWRNMMILGAGLGLMSVAVTLFLEPFGTANYQAPLRTLRLSGYALCFMIPVAAFHAIDRAVYRRQGRHWRLYNELISRPLLLITIFTSTWLYNIGVINGIAPSWSGWFDHMVFISLPYSAVLLPLGALAGVLLATRFPEAPPGAGRRLRIRGRNRDDALELRFDELVFAEAQQNYVQLHYLCGGRPDSRLFRITLAELQRQVPGLIRIHRSYLVNPDHVEQVEGNARKREIVLGKLGRRLPVSSDFDLSALGQN